MIEELLAKEHSKTNAIKIVQFIGDSASRFAQLVSLLTSSNQRLVQRASWPLSLVIEKQPELIYPHLGKLLLVLDTKPHVAFKRNLYRLLRGMEGIPEKHHASILTHCFNDITDSSQPAAVRAFAIHIMGKLCRLYPELKNELDILLPPLTDHDLPSIRSSANNVLKQIHKK